MYEGNIAIPTKGNVYVTAQTHVDGAKLRAIIDRMIAASFERAGQMTTNTLAASTLPNTPQTRFASSKAKGLKPNKNEVKKLQHRIKNDILGEGARLNTAIPRGDGRPVWEGENGVELNSSVPLLVQRNYRNRSKRRTNKPDRILSAEEAIAHIKANTYMFAKGKAGATRRMRSGAKFAWTTRAAWKRAADKFVKRAGNFIFGWSGMADAVHSAAVRGGVPTNGIYDSPGTGKFEASPENETFYLEGDNANAPGWKDRYLTSYINKNMQKWIDIGVETSMKQMNIRNIMKAAGNAGLNYVTVKWKK